MAVTRTLSRSSTSGICDRRLRRPRWRLRFSVIRDISGGCRGRSAAEKVILASDIPSHTYEDVKNAKIQYSLTAPAFPQLARFCFARRDPMHRYLVVVEPTASLGNYRSNPPLRNWYESFVSELTRFENFFASMDQFSVLEKSPASTTVIFSEFLTA